MKKSITLSIIVSLLLLPIACKKEAKDTPNLVPATPVGSERVVQLEGEFYYDDQAAVLKGKSFIYGVQRDLMAEELAKRTASKKRNEFDMIPVVLKGVVIDNPEIANGEEGWEKLVVIKKIVEITEPTDEETIKIESGN